MAAEFKIGDEVKLNVVLPQGKVISLSVSPDGELQYLVDCVIDGIDHQRWFAEQELVKV